MAAQQPINVIDIRRVHHVLSAFVSNPRRFCDVTLPAHDAYVVHNPVGAMLTVDPDPLSTVMDLYVPASNLASIVHALVAEDGYTLEYVHGYNYDNDHHFASCLTQSAIVVHNLLIRRRLQAGESEHVVTVYGVGINTNDCMLLIVDSLARAAGRTWSRGYFDGRTVYHMNPELTAMRIGVLPLRSNRRVGGDYPDDSFRIYRIHTPADGDWQTETAVDWRTRQYVRKELKRPDAATKIACVVPGPPPFAAELVEVACRPPCDPHMCTCDHIRVFCTMGGVLYREAAASHMSTHQ